MRCVRLPPFSTLFHPTAPPSRESVRSILFDETKQKRPKWILMCRECSSSDVYTHIPPQQLNGQNLESPPFFAARMSWKRYPFSLSLCNLKVSVNGKAYSRGVLCTNQATTNVNTVVGWEFLGIPPMGLCPLLLTHLGLQTKLAGFSTYSVVYTL